MKLLAFIILLSPSLFCQSFFFERGITSLSGGYSYSGNKNSASNAGSFIFSGAGYYDFGMSFSKSTLDGTNAEMFGVMPNISYTFRKPDRLGGFRLTLGYMFADLNIPVTQYHKLRFHAEGFVISGSVGAVLTNNENAALFLVPGIALSFLSAEGTEVEASKGINLELMFRFAKGSFGFFLSPGVGLNLGSSSNSSFSFAFTGGLLLNLTGKMKNEK